MNKIYLDSAASTKVHNEVIVKMQEALSDFYGNPSSTHSYGRSAKTFIEKARKNIAKCINASPSEIIFTSGGTEADNMILRSVVRDLDVQTIITSKIEHHAVLHTIKQLKEEYELNVEYVSLDEYGSPRIDDLEKKLKADSTEKLVSLMHVNNEIGNIIDIDEFVSVCKANNAYFHTDAVQSIGHFDWDVKKTKIDFLAASAHKFHGPKGIGFAYIQKDIPIRSLIFGGEQERGFRAGTEPLHNIVGLDEALAIATNDLREDHTYILGLKKYFISELKKIMPDVKFNGYSADDQRSTYALVNVCLPISEERSQLLLFQLDIKGIACSRGSACQSGSFLTSHVLKEVLKAEDLKKPSLRFSFSKYNTKDELNYVITVLKEFLKG